MSEIIDTVFHDVHHKMINNRQKEDCDIDDECISSGPCVDNSEGE